MADLKFCCKENIIEAGCDEAGRGCLAGPVFAAAVILPEGFYNPLLDDSKKVPRDIREELRIEIEKSAIAFAVASCTVEEVDKINILNASFLAMHRALKALSIQPQHIIVDGNRFKKYKNIPHSCIIKGDGIYASIAAASILAKTWRDEYMTKLHKEFPEYLWSKNKGYATQEHRNAIVEKGLCKYHRKTFTTDYLQLNLPL
jgi:ribonuclease HII